LVSADAIHTQKSTAQHLLQDKLADYLLVVKANQPKPFERLAELSMADDGVLSPLRTSLWTRATDGMKPGRFTHLQPLRISQDLLTPSKPPWSVAPLIISSPFTLLKVPIRSQERQAHLRQFEKREAC
jgi:hypothetical protein